MDEFVIKAYLALSCLIVHLWLPFFTFSGMIFFFFFWDPSDFIPEIHQ
jgi:hypothetical protein